MQPDDPNMQPRALRWGWFAIVAGVGVCFAFYGLLFATNLTESAALYLGLPVVLASAMALQPKSKSALGASMKGLTIALLLSAPLLREGFICILRASPILYPVVALVAWGIDRVRRSDTRRDRLRAGAVVTLFAVLSLEGTHPWLTFDRINTVTYETTLAGSVDAIRDRLAHPSAITAARPLLTRIFPPPVISGGGLSLGDTRQFDFSYEKWIFINHQDDHVVFSVTETDANHMRFAPREDTSYLSKYIVWESADITLTPVDAARTRVTTTIRFTRKLDPVWYVQPLQRHYVREAAKILTRTLEPPG